MLTEERRARLLEVIRQRGFAALPDLKREMGVSESTVRRDLDHLEQAGTAKRTHGGVFYTGTSPGLPHFEERQPAQWDKKQAIAQQTAKLVEDGDAVLFDGGTTTYEVARLLAGRPLHVVTNSMPVANLFSAEKVSDMVLVGGMVYPRTGVALGPYADEMLNSINVRRTILSVAGISERGYYNSNLLLVETERAMMRAADEVIVVADSTKFGHQSIAHLSSLGAVQRMVVDDGITAAWREKVQAAGVELIIAAVTDQAGAAVRQGDGENR